MHFLEGDYIELYDGSIWAVKGCHHPAGKVLSVPRLINNRKVKKLGTALNIVYRYYRHFITYVDFIGKHVPAIPEPEIRRYFNSINSSCPEDAGSLGSICNELIDVLRSRCLLKCGITGSLLYGKYDDTSDIDVVCMDSKDDVYECLINLREEGVLSNLDPTSFLTEYYQVAEGADFSYYLKLLSSKVLQGRYKSRKYTLKILNPIRESLILGPYAFTYKLPEVVIRILDTDFRTPSIYPAVLIRPPLHSKLASKVYVTSFRVRFAEVPKGSILLVSNAYLALRGDGVAIISLDEPDSYVRILT